MAQALTASLELGCRALLWALDVLPVCRLVAIARRDAHDFEHVLGIGLPIGCHMQDATNFQLLPHQFGECRLDDAPLVVAAFVPRVGEKQQYPVQARVGHAFTQHFQRIATVDPHVIQVL